MTAPFSPLAHAAAGSDSRVDELETQVETLLDVVAMLAHRIEVITQAFCSVHAWASSTRFAMEADDWTALHGAVFDLRSELGGSGGFRSLIKESG